MGLTVPPIGSKVRKYTPYRESRVMPDSIQVTQADRYNHLTEQVHNHSSVLQALQVDMQHAVKLLDKLVVVADKQTELAHELSRHSDSIGRVFTQVEGVEGKLTKAIEALTEVFKEDRRKADSVAETVTGYKTGLRTVTWALGTVGALVIIIGSMFAAQQAREITRSNLAIAGLDSDFERRKLALDIKMESLTQIVQDIKSDRQRDREALQNDNPRQR